jgi:hypothetical protein
LTPQTFAESGSGEVGAFVGNNLFNVVEWHVARRRREQFTISWGGRLDMETFADERDAGAGGGDEEDGHGYCVARIYWQPPLQRIRPGEGWMTGR